MTKLDTLKARRFLRLSREGLWVFFGQALAACASFASVKVLTQMMSPSAYGDLGLMLISSVFFNQIVFGPLTNGAIRYYSVAVSRNQLELYVQTLHTIFFKVVGLATLLLLGSLCLLAIDDQGRIFGVVAFGLVLAVVAGASSTILALFSAARERAIVASFQSMDAWFRLLITALMLQLFPDSWVASSWGIVISALLICVAGWLMLRRNVIFKINLKEKPDSDWSKMLWTYSWPFGVWGIFTGVQLSSERWALGHFRSSEELGLYVVLYQIGYAPILIFAGLLVQLLTPIFYNRMGDLDTRKSGTHPHLSQLKRVTNAIALVVLLATLCLALLAFFGHDHVFRYLVGETYRKTSNMLPVMILAAGFFATAQTIALALMSVNKTQVLLKIKIGSAVLGTVLNIVGAYMYGSYGVIFAVLTFSITYLVWLIIVFFFEMTKH